MTEDGFGAARKDGCEPMTSPLDHAVPKSENPAMERVEPPGRNAPVDGAATQAKREHLPPGNHPVLPGSEVRERSVRGCSQFASV